MEENALLNHNENAHELVRVALEQGVDLGPGKLMSCAKWNERTGSNDLSSMLVGRFLTTGGDKNRVAEFFRRAPLASAVAGVMFDTYDLGYRPNFDIEEARNLLSTDAAATIAPLLAIDARMISDFIFSSDPWDDDIEEIAKALERAAGGGDALELIATRVELEKVHLLGGVFADLWADRAVEFKKVEAQLRIIEDARTVAAWAGHINGGWRFLLEWATGSERWRQVASHQL